LGSRGHRARGPSVSRAQGRPRNRSPQWPHEPIESEIKPVRGLGKPKAIKK